MRFSDESIGEKQKEKVLRFRKSHLSIRPGSESSEKICPQVDWWRFRREQSRSNIKENTLVMEGKVVCMPADEASGRVSLSLARVKGSQTSIVAFSVYQYELATF